MKNVFHQAWLLSFPSYKTYVMLDPLGVVTKTRSAIEEEEASMAEAPSTITHNQEMLNPMADDLTYRPVMADLPDIAVPGNLPNLPGKIF